jgi:hypothetical protein
MPEYRKLVKQFNDTGVILMRHEVDVQTAWLNRNPSIRQSFGHTKPHEKIHEYLTFEFFYVF